LAKIKKDAANESMVSQEILNEIHTSQVVSFSVSDIQVLKKRSDFIAASKALRQSMRSMLVQARMRNDDDATMRVGFTCSKKVGNAVIRNRAKRRLREVARAVVTRHGKAGFDYVFVGRNTVTEQADFDSLIQDATLALQKLHSIQRP